MTRTRRNPHRLLTLAVSLARAAGCTKQAAPVEPVAAATTPDFQDQSVCIAVLDDGRVLFDAGFLTGPSSVSTIYWLRWDAAAATLVVDKSAAFSSEM